MKLTTGIVRTTDDLGRIVIPMEVRRRFAININDPVEIYVEGEKIILRKYVPTCYFCSDESDISTYKNINICKNCINELK